MNGMSSCKNKSLHAFCKTCPTLTTSVCVCVDWDEAIGNITDTLKRVGMWEKTLWVMSGE